MKTLVLITSQFPYGTGETFITEEYSLLAKNFEKIFIISQNVKSETLRQVSENTKVFRYDPATSLKGFFYLPFLIASELPSIKNMVVDEISFRRRNKYTITRKNYVAIFRKIIKALQLKNYIEKLTADENIRGPVVYYSYWMKTGANAISLLRKNNCITIARAHGSDIYEERTAQGYLPLLNYSADNLDAVFFISENGLEYIKRKTGKENDRFIVSRLGVREPVPGEKKKSGRFVIVSCSNIIPLKRIDLIIYALSLVDSEKEIEWIHFGDGTLRSSLETLAGKKLKDTRVTYRFMGYVPNDELLKFYSSNSVDLFLNVSSTEGIPVSIMEAQSYAIPVIATDTGGVKEIIVQGSGSLLPVDLNPAVLASEISHYLNLTETEGETMKVNAYNNWKCNFNAISNYQSFITKVSSILAGN